jgi:hypothetical protein
MGHRERRHFSSNRLRAVSVTLAARRVRRTGGCPARRTDGSTPGDFRSARAPSGIGQPGSCRARRRGSPLDMEDVVAAMLAPPVEDVDHALAADLDRDPVGWIGASWTIVPSPLYFPMNASPRTFKRTTIVCVSSAPRGLGPLASRRWLGRWWLGRRWPGRWWRGRWWRGRWWLGRRWPGRRWPGRWWRGRWWLGH